MWENLRTTLRKQLGDGIYSLWIEPLECNKFENNALELRCPDKFTCSWIEKNLIKEMDRLLSEACGQEARVTLTTNGGKKTASSPAAANNSAEQLRLPSMPKTKNSYRTLNPRYIFDEFIVGESNAFAHGACRALADGDTSMGRYLFIKAGTGLGKSHLTHAVAHHVLSLKPHLRLNYLTAQQLTAEMVNSIRTGAMDTFKNKYHQSDVLLMEDLQSLTGRAKTQEELALLFDILLESGRTIIFTGSLAPREMKNIDPSVQSRLSSGLVTTIKMPDLQTRINITIKKAQNYNLNLKEELAVFIAERINGDIRQIKSAIVGLKAKSTLLRKSPDLDMVREVLDDIIQREDNLTPELVRDFIAKQFKVSVQDIQSKSRKKTIAFPRQVSMYLSRKHTEKPLADIGKVFNRDHSTVVHSIRVITEAIARNGSVRGQVDLLSDKLLQHYPG